MLVDPEPGGLGFTGVYAKWLVESGPGSEPNAFDSGGRIRPAIVVLPGERNPHPSEGVAGWAKWDQFPSVYLFQYPGSHGKELLDNGVIEVEKALTDRTWQPIITANQKPFIHANPNETHIDNNDQFPGNYVVVLRFRVTGIRLV
jgi:hypothetical protein